MKMLVLLLCLVSPVSAQTVTTGPVSTLNKVAWGMPDGVNINAAQAFEARIFVDGATTPLVLTGVVCLPNVLTDSSGGVWSYGSGQAPSIQILRNGVQPNGAYGIKMAVLGGVLYLQGDDNTYFKWTGTTFLSITPSDPLPSVIDAAAVTRWSCQAPVTLALMRLLNVRIAHVISLRLYDVVNRSESKDSVPFSLTTPQFVTQPITVRIIQ